MDHDDDDDKDDDADNDNDDYYVAQAVILLRCVQVRRVHRELRDRPVPMDLLVL